MCRPTKPAAPVTRILLMGSDDSSGRLDGLRQADGLTRENGAGAASGPEQNGLDSKGSAAPAVVFLDGEIFHLIPAVQVFPQLVFGTAPEVHGDLVHGLGAASLAQILFFAAAVEVSQEGVLHDALERKAAVDGV